MHHLRPLHLDDSLISRLDPRIKLLCALSLLVMAVSSPGVRFPVLVGFTCVAAALASGARPRILAIRLAQPLLVALLVVCIKTLAGKEPLGSLSLPGVAVTLHSDGLRDGLLIASRIIGACSVAALLVLSTSFTDLLAALSWLRVPRGLTEVSLFAWRSLFLLYEDARVVYGAQRNRLGYAGWRRGFSSLGTLAGMLVVKAFDGSQSMTTAMAQRGYDGSLPLLRHRPFRRLEVAACSLLILVAGALWRMI